MYVCSVRQVVQRPASCQPLEPGAALYLGQMSTKMSARDAITYGMVAVVDTFN